MTRPGGAQVAHALDTILRAAAAGAGEGCDRAGEALASDVALLAEVAAGGTASP